MKTRTYLIAVLVIFLLLFFYLPLWPEKVKLGEIKISTWDMILVRQGKLMID